MSRKRHSMKRILAMTSNEEELTDRKSFVAELLFVVATGLAQEIDGFSIKATRVRAQPAKRSDPPRYTLPEKLGRINLTPKSELVRVVSVTGVYGFLEDDDAIPFESEMANERLLTVPTGLCSFSAMFELYYHSWRWKWEPGWLHLAYTDGEGWQEPITREFTSQAKIEKDGSYTFKLTPKKVEVL